MIPGGADWQLVTVNDVALLDARYTLRTHDDALIYVSNKGVRHGPVDILQKVAAGETVDPAQYYFRTTPRFETSAAHYTWLNHMIAVASGMRTRDKVVLEFYEVQ